MCPELHKPCEIRIFLAVKCHSYVFPVSEVALGMKVFICCREFQAVFPFPELKWRGRQCLANKLPDLDSPRAFSGLHSLFKACPLSSSRFFRYCHLGGLLLCLYCAGSPCFFHRPR